MPSTLALLLALPVLGFAAPAPKAPAKPKAKPAAKPVAKPVAKPAKQVEGTTSTVRVKSEEGKRLIEGIAKVLDEKLSSVNRRRLGRKVLSKSRISIARGTFPASGGFLVTVNVDLRGKDPSGPQKYIAGMFTLTASGDLATIVVPPKTRTKRFDVVSIKDMNGDGSDDFVFTALDAEQTVRHRITWEGSKPVDKAGLAKPTDPEKLAALK